MTEELESYWKKPDPQAGEVGARDSGPGLWSRSRVFRIALWAVTIIAALALALVASSYLSGFSSPIEMFRWFSEGFGS